MKKLLLLLLTFSMPVMAIDVFPDITPTKTITCVMPVEYISNRALDTDDVIITRLFVNGVDTGVTANTCRFVIDVTAIPVGTYHYSVMAISTKYGTESVLASPPAELNILVPQTPNAPTQLTWE